MRPGESTRQLPKLSHVAASIPSEYAYCSTVVFRKTRLTVLLAALSCLGAGCATTTPALVPLGKATVTVDPAARPTQAKAQIMNEVIVVLAPPDRAGYVWQITQHNSETLRQLSPLTPREPSGESIVSFLALRSGRTRILFALVPPTEKAEMDPVDVREIDLTID